MTSTTTEWLSPSARPEPIHTLINGVDRYNPQNVSILEDYLYHQIRMREYDCLANLAILKLYQFNPDLYNADVVVNILLKALTAAPLPDFNLCLALLGERHQGMMSQEEPDPLPILLPSLIALSTLLHQCQFPNFWAVYRSPELENLRDNYTVEFVGFEESARNVVVKAVRSAFGKIGRARLQSYLDLDGSELEAYLQKLGWTFDPLSGVITTPPNEDNTIEATVVRENIQLPQLAKVIAHAQGV